MITDVCDQDSDEEAHIANVLDFSMEKLQEYLEKADKEKPVLVYCYDNELASIGFSTFGRAGF